MKSNLSKIFGVVVSVAMLMSLLVVGSPAKAGTLAYSTESLPSGITYVTNATSLTDYAVANDGQTIYAVNGNIHLYKSTNGGSTWSRIDLSAVNGSTWTYVAVAPDNPSIVAVASNNATGPFVLVSTNGGASGGADSWSSAGAITNTVTAMAASLTDLAISPAVSNARQVVVTGALTSGLPGVYALNLGGTVASWTDVSAFTGGVVAGSLAGIVHAVQFSPNYLSDRVMTAVAINTATGNITFNLARFLTATTGQWNVAAGFLDYDGQTTARGIVGPAATGGTIVGADISLAPTYSGLDSASRIAFVSINDGVGGAASGVFRMSDSVRKEISDASLAPFTSVAFNGTNLVAGRSADNVVYRSSDPLASTPTFTATTQFQRPSGGVAAAATTTMVDWAGTNVVASTVGNESAFSRSGDNGATFNDVSQINTSLAVIVDFAVAPDGSKIYMTSNDGADSSLWVRTGTTWERVFSVIADAGAFTIRIAPENSAVVYVVDNGSTTLYYSDDSANKNIVTRISNEAIVDLAVESASTIYYVNGFNVRKSTNAGFLWNDPAVAALTSGTPITIKSLGTDKLLVTNSAGVVSYSTNGGTSFTRLTLSGGGAVQATADTLATGTYVYAVPGAGHTLTATTTGVYRYTIGSTGADAVWTLISPSATAATVFTGIVLKGGILYAHAHDAGVTDSSLYRTLNPTDAATTVTFSVLTAATTLAATPDFTIAGGRVHNLQLSTASGINTIYGIDEDVAGAEESALDTATDEIYSFTDTLSAPATQVGPAANAVIDVNPVSGGSFALTLTWNRPSLATAYLVQVAFDDKFTQPAVVVPAVVPADPAISPVAAVIAAGALNPGTKYYWRVRATAPVQTPWSATGTFTTKSLDKPFALAGPMTGDTNVSTKPVLSWSAYAGAKWYEVTLSEDPTFAIPEWSHNVNGTVYGVVATETLKYGTTYYWRVRGVTADPFVQGTQVITPAGPWVVGAFTTMAEPVAPKTEQVIVKEVTPAPPPQIVQVPVEKIVQQPIPNWMLMTIIVIGAVLVIALIVLIVRTRRVA